MCIREQQEQSCPWEQIEGSERASGWECVFSKGMRSHSSEGWVLQAEVAAAHGDHQEAQTSEWWSPSGIIPQESNLEESRQGQTQGWRQSSEWVSSPSRRLGCIQHILKGTRKKHTRPGSMHGAGSEAVDKTKPRQWLTLLLLAISKYFI